MSNKQRKVSFISFSFLMPIILAAIWLAGFASQAWAQAKPSLEIDPPRGPVPTEVTIAGKGYKPDDKVTYHANKTLDLSVPRGQSLLMYLILWEFRPRKGQEAEFEKAYGPAGEWARLFRLGAGYLGTELLRDSDGRYVTIDRWTSVDAFKNFRQQHAGEYEAVDKKCELLTEVENLIGHFTSIDA